MNFISRRSFILQSATLPLLARSYSNTVQAWDLLRQAAFIAGSDAWQRAPKFKGPLPLTKKKKYCALVPAMEMETKTSMANLAFRVGVLGLLPSQEIWLNSRFSQLGIRRVMYDAFAQAHFFNLWNYAKNDQLNLPIPVSFEANPSDGRVDMEMVVDGVPQDLSLSLDGSARSLLLTPGVYIIAVSNAIEWANFEIEAPLDVRNPVLHLGENQNSPFLIIQIQKR